MVCGDRVCMRTEQRVLVRVIGREILEVLVPTFPFTTLGKSPQQSTFPRKFTDLESGNSVTVCTGYTQTQSKR